MVQFNTIFHNIEILRVNTQIYVYYSLKSNDLRHTDK